MGCSDGIIVIGQGKQHAALVHCLTATSVVVLMEMLGEYDTYRAGMLLNCRPDGSFTNW